MHGIIKTKGTEMTSIKKKVSVSAPEIGILGVVEELDKRKNRLGLSYKQRVGWP